jgi:hypothetical protein
VLATYPLDCLSLWAVKFVMVQAIRSLSDHVEASASRSNMDHSRSFVRCAAAALIQRVARFNLTVKTNISMFYTNSMIHERHCCSQIAATLSVCMVTLVPTTVLPSTPMNHQLTRRRLLAGTTHSCGVCKSLSKSNMSKHRRPCSRSKLAYGISHPGCRWLSQT